MKNKRPAVGIISPPAWFDPAPAEFPRVCVEEVRTQQASLPLPDFDYKLGSIASIQDELNLCAPLSAAISWVEIQFKKKL